MKRTIQIIAIILAAVLVFGALLYTRHWLAEHPDALHGSKEKHQVADIEKIRQQIKSDSLYEVKNVLYRDSGILISITNPDKSGTEDYFDKRYKLNEYDNINMVYIYAYDSTVKLDTVSFDDALMAKGKKMGRFQDEWTKKFIDTTDGSCIPVRAYVKSKLYNPESFKNRQTVYQPENIHSMRVVCRYAAKDSTGHAIADEIAASVDLKGTVEAIASPTP